MFVQCSYSVHFIVQNSTKLSFIIANMFLTLIFALFCVIYGIFKLYYSALKIRGALHLLLNRERPLGVHRHLP